MSWRLYKSCSSDSLHDEGSLAPAPAQHLHGPVTLIRGGSPVGGSASSPVNVKVELMICCGEVMHAIHSFSKGLLSTYYVPGTILSLRVQ